MPSTRDESPVRQLFLGLAHVPKDGAVDEVEDGCGAEDEEGRGREVVGVGFGPVPPEDTRV